MKRDGAIRIQVLSGADAGLMRAMLGMFAVAFEEPHAYTASQPDDAHLQSLLASENFIAVAATLGGDVIGGLAAYVLPKFEQARKEVYLYDLAVLAEHRRKGVATAVIAAPKREGRGRPSRTGWRASRGRRSRSAPARWALGRRRARSSSC